MQGLFALTFLELFLQVYFPLFPLFSSDISLVLVNLAIKLTLTALGSKLGEKILLFYNSFTGAALLVSSISYLARWIPNPFQLVNQRRQCLNPRQVPTALPSGSLTSPLVSRSTSSWWRRSGPWPSCATCSVGADA